MLTIQFFWSYFSFFAHHLYSPLILVANFVILVPKKFIIFFFWIYSLLFWCFFGKDSVLLPISFLFLYDTLYWLVIKWNSTYYMVNVECRRYKYQIWAREYSKFVFFFFHLLLFSPHFLWWFVLPVAVLSQS